MKKPPTLADLCVETAMNRHSSHLGPQYKAILADVVNARKFVLDDRMCQYWAEQTHRFHQDVLIGRLQLIDNARLHSRTPFPLAWIEFNNYDFAARRKFLSGSKSDVHNFRMGWLLRQHPHSKTSIKATEIKEGTISFKSGSPKPFHGATIRPLSSCWSCCDAPDLWPRMLGTVDTPECGRTATVDDQTTLDDLTLNPDDASSSYNIRDLWALLETINDLPVTYEIIRPARGSMVRGVGYRRYLKHTVVHLTVPETRYKILVNEVAEKMERRAHDVRGHFCDFWMQRPLENCFHSWKDLGDDTIECDRCNGKQFWRDSHIRGNEKLGWVIHNYEVHRQALENQAKRRK
jgi:hypothetical protein